VHQNSRDVEAEQRGKLVPEGEARKEGQTADPIE
jgi:hypothetical protein